MTLLELGEGQTAVIRALRGDVATMRRMHTLGLRAGRTVRLVRVAPFSGPLLLEDQASGARWMIARAMAVDIEVRDARAAVG